MNDIDPHSRASTPIVSHNPATTADKAPADLVPVGYTAQFRLDELLITGRGNLWIEEIPRNSSVIPLYGPEAAERIAALEAARAEQWRMRREAESQRDLEKCLADTFRDERDEAVKRAETAEARAAELQAALTPSAETKAAYIGEFSFHIPSQDDEGNEVSHKITVPWDVIKDIMSAIRSRAALAQKEGQQ